MAIQTPTTASAANDLRQSGWSPPSQASLTLAVFFRSTAGNNAFRAFGHLHDGGPELVFQIDDGNHLSFYEGGNKAAQAGTTALNTWYFGAWTCNAGALATYQGAIASPGTALTTASGTAGGVNTAPTNFEFLNDSYNEPWFGQVESLRIWTGVLTAAELEQERRSLRPVRLANLFAWYKWNNIADRLVDYSGNGRVLVQPNVGSHTTTTADGPGVRLRRSRRRTIKAATATSGVNGTISASLPVPTSAASGVVCVTGTVAASLPRPTSAASGSVSVIGTAAAALPVPTSSAAGSVSVIGTLAAALPVPTMAASGTVEDDGVEGTIAASLPLPTMAAAGSVSVIGTAAAALPAPTMAAEGYQVESVTGTLTATLPAPTSSAAGDVAVVGTLSASLPLPTMAASGSQAEVVAGVITASLPAPTMAATNVGYLAEMICNLALARLGVGYRIRSIREETLEAELCLEFYERTRDTVLSAHPWRFAKKQAELEALEDERTGWSDVYALPSDCLTPLSIWSGVRVPRADQKIPFEICISDDEAEPILATVLEDAVLIYIARITDTSVMHPLFAEAFAWLLAAELALPLTGKLELREQAMLMFRRTLSEAKAVTMNEEHDTPQQSYLLTVRGWEEVSVRRQTSEEILLLPVDE